MLNKTNKNFFQSCKRVIFMVIALFIAAFITRIPAINFPYIYALHGVLAAPFFSAVAIINLKKANPFWEYAVSVLLLAGALGSMSMVMGLSFVLVAFIYMLFCLISFVVISKTNHLLSGCIIGLFCYLSAVLVGVIFGSFAISFSNLPQVLLLTISSGLLGLLGAKLVAVFYSQTPRSL